MKTRNHIRAAGLAVALILAAARTFGQAGALLPYTFVGKLSNYSGVRYGTNSAVEIRVRNLDGALLAKSAIRTSSESPYNYRLAVPVASAPATGYAMVGESLVIEIYDGVGITHTSLVPAGQAVVGNPGDVGVIDIVLATDANDNGIPDQYENYIAYLMAIKDMAGPYDPDADYDADGFSNRAEFLAGTGPLNATDRLHIVTGTQASGPTGGGLFAITFVTAAGRSYSVKGTSTLTAMAEAAREPFKTAPAAAPQTYLHTSSLQAEAVTLYLIPQGATRFYQLVVE